ncbi:MAG TPA: thioredoxin, partial [Flavobacteriales bacterium]|nr:thioredoxin [Flavobacteriales bacterium]
LEGKLSYPSYVILDENQTRLMIYQGAKPVDQLMGILLFFSTDQYKYYHNYL